MKKSILIFTMLLGALTALAQQKPDYVQTHTGQVLSNWSTKAVKSITLPCGAVPSFPAWVPDSDKCAALFVVTSGTSWKKGLYKYSCDSTKWLMVSANVDMISGNVHFTGKDTIDHVQVDSAFITNAQISNVTVNNITTDLANSGYITYIKTLADDDYNAFMVLSHWTAGTHPQTVKIVGFDTLATKLARYLASSAPADAKVVLLNSLINSNFFLNGQWHFTNTTYVTELDDALSADKIILGSNDINLQSNATDIRSLDGSTTFAHFGDGSTSAASYMPNLQVYKAPALANEAVNLRSADSLYVAQVVDIPTLQRYAGTSKYAFVTDVNQSTPFKLIDTTGTGYKADTLLFYSTSAFPGKLWQRLYNGPVNIKWAGAIPVLNDTTGVHEIDNTVAIQHCMDVVQRYGGGGVYMPAGYFGVTNIEIGDHVRFFGEGAGSHLVKMPGSDNLPLLQKVHYGSMFEVDHMEIMGNRANCTGTSDGIYINQTNATAPPHGYKFGTFGSAVPSLHDLYMRDFSQFAIHLRSVIGIDVYNVYGRRTVKDVYYFDKVTDSRFWGLAALQASILGGGYSGFHISGSAGNNKFTNLKSGSNGITGDTTSHGIYCSGARNTFAAIDCQSNFGDGFRADSNANNTTMTGMNFDSNLKAGFRARNNTGQLYGLHIEGASYRNTSTSSKLPQLWGWRFEGSPTYSLFEGTANKDSLADVIGTMGTGSFMRIQTQDNTGLVNTVYNWSANLSGNTVAASTTTYAALTSINSYTTTEGQRQVICPVSGYIGGLYVVTNATQNAGGSLVVTIRNNSSNTAVTTTIAAGAAAGTFTDLTDKVAVNAGDLLSIQLVNNYSGGVSAGIKGISLSLYK